VFILSYHVFEAFHFYVRTSHPLKKVRLEKSGSHYQNPRVARLAFLTPNFTISAFLEALGVKKLFGFFSAIFGFSGGSAHMISDWCLVIRLFYTVLIGVFSQTLHGNLYLPRIR